MSKYYTEKQARKQWCPEVRIIARPDGTMFTNRGDELRLVSSPTEQKAMFGCIGSECGVWVEGPEVEKAEVDKASGRIKLENTGRCGKSKG